MTSRAEAMFHNGSWEVDSCSATRPKILSLEEELSEPLPHNSGLQVRNQKMQKLNRVNSNAF